MTSSAPSARFVATVAMVASTSCVRFSTVLATIPGGSALLIASILASAAADTVRLLPPISISAVPTTTSCPFELALPVRSSRPIDTSARSFTRTRHAAAGGDHDLADLRDILDAASGAHDIASRRCARYSRAGLVLLASIASTMLVNERP